MPLYEFRCRTCDEVFEVRRPMAEANDPAPCPSGHEDSVRRLSVFASVGAPSATPPTGGCGSGCGCAH